ncbi:proline-tRNA ligase [Allomyces macrogynus ATCC 38327]|uniref:proline--tRNA ligase n=1 Tax=Allomyces macrogynus (strain ATCC 38327) TaxID=578462 RepID=A0A0L0SIM8_ALLM3|nr:proline-tRNA ligase [Allomyces macrogynus ATCC 38327]|eukprot:KNE62363.1 proline-tRNA ligase [Allomyces macrogynus ATCC 38327]
MPSPAWLARLPPTTAPRLPRPHALLAPLAAVQAVAVRQSSCGSTRSNAAHSSTAAAVSTRARWVTPPVTTHHCRVVATLPTARPLSGAFSPNDAADHLADADLDADTMTNAAKNKTASPAKAAPAAPAAPAPAAAPKAAAAPADAAKDAEKEAKKAAKKAAKDAKKDKKANKDAAAAAPAKKAAAPAAAAAADGDKGVQIGIEAKKEDDTPRWYQQVLTRSEMLDYYDVSGCYILRPWAYGIWQEIQGFFDGLIRESGVENCYFPMFVSGKALEREKDHVEGFAPEVAWVTKAGSSDLAEPIAIRPTSETVMYPAYAKWIQSHRDLPLRLNQWCNVVRWEFKHPQPFLRTREFLWQEGHTAFLTQPEADAEVLEILGYYRRVYEDLLAVPVIPGRKSEKEKFAGGLYTTTVEAFVPVTGRGIQGATSHCLGQNFAKMFNIVVEGANKEAQHVWQNSWGLTTRTIGVMVMVHGDNKGLVLPPRVAAQQVVVVPCGITVKTTQEQRDAIAAYTNQVVATLKKAGIRAKADTRDNYSPGYKFNHWEMRGVPLRIEVGPKDMAKNQVLTVRRDSGAKNPLPMENLGAAVNTLLESIQADMLAKATKERDEHLKNLVMAPWCTEPACEDQIKDRSARAKVEETGEPADDKAPSMGAKSLCIPFNQPREIKEGKMCFQGCGRKAVAYGLFGRSY